MPAESLAPVVLTAWRAFSISGTTANILQPKKEPQPLRLGSSDPRNNHKAHLTSSARAMCVATKTINLSCTSGYVSTNGDREETGDDEASAGPPEGRRKKQLFEP
jgi:hypothetical protein